MIDLWLALIVVGTIFILIVLLFTVERTIRALDSEEVSVIGAVWTTLFAVVSLAVFIPATLVQGSLSVGTSLISNYRVVLIFSGLVVTSTVATSYSINAFQLIDSLYTPLFAPLYIQVIVPIINIIRLTLDIVTCWLSFVLVLFNEVVTELRKIIFKCTRTDSQLVATTAKRFIEAVLQSTFNFFGTAFGEPLHFRQPVIELGQVASALANPYVCACNDLEFVYDIFNQSVNSINLADGIDNVSAVIYYIAKPMVQLSQGIFFSLPNAPFQCSGSPSEIILCEISRPPKLTQAANNTCLAIENLSEWIMYDVVKAIVTSFFDIVDEDAIPNVSGFVAGPLCSIIDVAELSVDLFTHFDLVFDSSVYYLRYVNVSQPIRKLIPVGKAINSLFRSFNTDVTDEIGCAFESLTNATIFVSELIIRSIHLLTTDPAGIPTFLQNYPYSDIRKNWNQFFVCFVTAIADLFGNDDSVELVLQYGFNTTDQFSYAFYDAFVHVEQIFDSFNSFTAYTINVFSPNIKSAQAYGLVFTITLNNFLRAIDDGNCVQLPLNYGWGVPGILYGTGFFCCLGNIAQAYSQLALGLQVIVFDIYADFIGIIGSYPAYTVERLFTDVIDTLDDKLIPVILAASESNTCLISSLFSEICCPVYGDPCTRAERVSIPVAELIGVINEPVVLVTDLIRLILGLGKTAITNPSDLFEEVFCNTTKLGYDASVGVIAKIVKGFIRFGACFANEGLNDVAETIQEIFIDDSGIKQIICSIAEVIINLISLLYYLFSGNISQFAIQLISLIPGLGSAVNTAARVVCYVQRLPQWIGDCFSNNQISICLGTFCFDVPNIIAVVNCIGNIPSLDNSPCNSVTVIPEKKRKLDNRNLEELMGEQISKLLETSHLNDTTSPCYHLANFIYNSTDEEPFMLLKTAMRYEYRRCIVTVGLSDYFNILVQDELVQRDYLYDIVSFTNGTVFIFQQVSPIVIWFTMNHIKHKYNITWDEYKQENSIKNGSISERIGDAINRIFEQDIQDWKNSDSIFAFLVAKIMKFAKLIGYDAWFGDKGLFSLSKRTYQELSKRDPKAYIDFLQKVNVDKGLVRFLNQSFYRLENFTRNAKRNWNEFARPKTTRTLKNRMTFYLLAKNITNTINVAFMKSAPEIKRNNQWWDDTVLPHIIPEDMLVNRQSIIPCIGTKCLNCSILENVLNKLARNIEICIDDMKEQSYDVDKIYIKDPQHKFIKPSWSLVSDFPAQTYINPDSKNLGIYVFKIINYIPKALGFDLFQLANVMGTFFDYNNRTDTKSVTYWMYFLSECNFERDLQCRKGPVGFGLYYSLLVMGVLYVILTVSVALIFGNNLFILTGIWLTFPFITLFGAYFWNPRCFPAPPDCVYDDIYAAFKYFEYPCIDWNGVFPNITTSTCPTESVGYLRPFTNCYNDYYGFGDAGFRNIFYLFERYEPSINNYIRNSDSIIAETLRKIPVVYDNINFPWQGPGLPDEYRAFEGCYRASILSLSVPATLASKFYFFFNYALTL